MNVMPLLERPTGALCERADRAVDFPIRVTGAKYCLVREGRLSFRRGGGYREGAFNQRGLSTFVFLRVVGTGADRIEGELS